MEKNLKIICNSFFGIKKVIQDYKIKEKLPSESIVAKKIDEYHYVEIVMRNS